MNSITVTGQMTLNLNVETARNFLCDLNNISKYEPKLTSAQVQPQSESKRFYTTKGRFLGFAWQGRFTYELKQSGFHSQMIAGPLANQMQGGFVVKSLSKNQCMVSHFEQYKFSKWSKIFNPVLSYYLKRSMNKEMRSIEKLTLTNQDNSTRNPIKTQVCFFKW